MAHDNMTSNSINRHHNEIKSESLHTFDNIDGEFNIIMSGSVNNEVPRTISQRVAGIKTEMFSETERTGKSVDEVNSNLSNGNFGSMSEYKENKQDNGNNLSSEEVYEFAVIDQNSNLTFTKEKKDTATGESTESIITKKLVKASDLDLNNSQISEKTSTTVNRSLDELILVISDNSDASDTDEVDSDSSNNEEVSQKDELPPKELSNSVLDDEAIDKTLHEISHKNSATWKSTSQVIHNKASNSNQTSLLNFLVPRKPVMIESLGNETHSRKTRISISHLIINSCTNCDNRYNSFGMKIKTCKVCGKRMKFNCFICKKLYNTCNGIYSHILQFHQFSLKLFNEKIYSLTKSFCSKCKFMYRTEYLACPKCNLNLEFGCLLCDEWSKTRLGIFIHAVQSHTTEFLNSSETANTNHQHTSKIKEDKGLLKSNEDQDLKKDVSLTEDNTATCKNDYDSKQRSLNKRKVRFQLNNKETNRENEIEDISKSEDTEPILGPTPRNSGRRRSISTKIDTSLEMPNKSNNKISSKLSNNKQSITNRRQKTNVNLDSSTSKNSAKAISNNEDTIITPTGPKQQMTGRLPSNRANLNNSEVSSVNETLNSSDLSVETSAGCKQQMTGRLRSSRVNLNNSEVSSVNETLNSSNLSVETSGFAVQTSDRRRNINVRSQNNNKTDDDIQPQSEIAPVNQPNRSRRQSSRISRISDHSTNVIRNDNASLDLIEPYKTSKPKKQITNKRRRSRSVTDDPEINNHQEISFVEVHPIPAEHQSKPLDTTGKRQSFQITSSNSETSSHRKSTPIHTNTSTNIPAIVPEQPTSSKRRSVRIANAKSEPTSLLENSNISPKLFDFKSPAVQGKRRSSRAMLDTRDRMHQDKDTFLGNTTALDIPAANQKVSNKRRKSEKSINAKFDNSYSETSMNESNNESSDDPKLCRFCQKSFINERSCKQHEFYCNTPYIFCDCCSFVTKYVSNMKKHKLTMHGSLKDPTTVQAETLNGSIGYGTLYSIDSTCKDILAKMEAHCPKCIDDANMKPNDSNCRKCKSKLKLTCVKCNKVFSNFLSIFNHLYMECSKKQYLCVQCDFTTTSLDTIESHMHSHHGNLSNSNSNQGLSELPFTFTAQPKRAILALNDSKKAKLQVGYKTRSQSSVKPRQKVTVEATVDDESKLKKCSRCNMKVPSVRKHFAHCIAELKCPFCTYTTKMKPNLTKHLLTCHKTKSHTTKFQKVFTDGSVQFKTRDDKSKDRPAIEKMMRSYCSVCDQLKETVPFKFKCDACQTDLQYRCNTCPAKFALREQLRKHVWNHVKHTKYRSCAGCSKGFAYMENLLMHEKVCSTLLNNASKSSD